MEHFMNVVIVLILEFLSVVINIRAGHHTGHHAGHHTNHGHRGRQGHIEGGAGRHNIYVGQGGNNNCRHDHGHVAGGGHQDPVPSMHRSGGKKLFNPISFILNSENKQPRKSAAHAKKKGHADTIHSQTTQKEVNPGKSIVLDVAECNHNIITY